MEASVLLVPNLEVWKNVARTVIRARSEGSAYLKQNNRTIAALTDTLSKVKGLMIDRVKSSVNSQVSCICVRLSQKCEKGDVMPEEHMAFKVDMKNFMPSLVEFGLSALVLDTGDGAFAEYEQLKAEFERVVSVLFDFDDALGRVATQLKEEPEATRVISRTNVDNFLALVAEPPLGLGEQSYWNGFVRVALDRASLQIVDEIEKHLPSQLADFVRALGSNILPNDCTLSFLHTAPPEDVHEHLASLQQMFARNPDTSIHSVRVDNTNFCILLVVASVACHKLLFNLNKKHSSVVQDCENLVKCTRSFEAEKSSFSKIADLLLLSGRCQASVAQIANLHAFVGQKLLTMRGQHLAQARGDVLEKTEVCSILLEDKALRDVAWPKEVTDDVHRQVKLLLNNPEPLKAWVPEYLGLRDLIKTQERVAEIFGALAEFEPIRIPTLHAAFDNLTALQVLNRELAPGEVRSKLCFVCLMTLKASGHMSEAIKSALIACLNPTQKSHVAVALEDAT